MSERFLHAVFGQPVAHSLSPRIHAAFAAQAGIDLDYRRIEAAPEAFADALAAFAGAGGHGANVTLPLKERAAALCIAITPRAQRAGSVNTLTRDPRGWVGDTTDGIGLLTDLAMRHGLQPAGLHVLMLGAGGAARAAAFALLDAGIDRLVIANRTPARAQQLAAALADPRATAVAADAAPVGPFDLIVNASAAGHHGAAPPVAHEILRSARLAYDLSYGAAAAPFLALAKSAGAARTVDGLGMLVEQAAASFAIWHGHAPDTAPVYAALRAQAR
ncbi:MAG TPA: shikimate dehydrogenase [Dokdonella sp.]|uniref:shikimate dehydrogenase n=1 Tax=Dokdonella sp. TaxID=2291710 RepID=UPI002D03C262|nr:shikimate dehydrogenase [Dokdonella sp.]HUD41377.1 shikimate dehydrogenase [Dokdonella sp.]